MPANVIDGCQVGLSIAAKISCPNVVGVELSVGIVVNSPAGVIAVSLGEIGVELAGIGGGYVGPAIPAVVPYPDVAGVEFPADKSVDVPKL